MKTNVFLRSAKRQPVRTAALLLVTALITFAFVSRGAEYLLIRQETERLGSYYQSVGSLRPISEERYKDTGEAAAYLESSPLVEAVNTYSYVSGVIQDGFCNANTEFTMNYIGAHFVFTGRLVEWNKSQFKFLVDEVLAGPPEYMEEGQTVVLTRTQGKSQTLDMEEGLDGDPVDSNMPFDFPWEGLNFFGYMWPVYSEQEEAYAALEMEGRYLAVGYYEPGKGSMCRVVRELKTDPETEEEYEEKTTYAVFSHTLEDAFFYQLPDSGEIDWSDPRLSLTRERLELIQEETRALNVIPLRDMSALPQVQDPEAGIYLTQGRWLDRRDDEQENRVCVVSASLATLRDLALGDTITIQLRDTPSYFGQSGEGWDLDVRSLQTSTDTYEIVGIYDYLDTYGFTGIYHDTGFGVNPPAVYANTAVSNFVYVPAFALPEGFRLDRGNAAYKDAINGARTDYGRWFTGDKSTLPLPGSVSIKLTSPELEGQFVEESQEPLAALGFAVDMTENGWESFQTAARPMRESSLYNAVVFSVVMLVTLGLAAFIYFFSRRREMDIARSLGLPGKAAAGQIMVPLLLTGVPAILAGSGMGWLYAGSSAGALLESLPAVPGAEAASTDLPAAWLGLLCGVPLLLLVALAAGGARFLAAQPLVKQQMGVKKVKDTAIQSTAPVRSAAAPVYAGAPVFAAAPAPRSASRTLGAAHVLRFVWRYMVRSWVKSLLTVALAVVFTVSLTAIQVSIAGSRQEVNDLYERTPVGVELLKADSTQATTAGAFLFDDTLQTILDTGFISDCYLEGANYCTVFRYDEPWEPGQILYIANQVESKRTIRSIDDTEDFFSGIGSGKNVSVTYADGWDETLFAEDWDASTGVAIPIVLPKETWDAFDIQPGDLMAVACKGAFHMCAVAGYYEGEVSGEYKAMALGSQSYNDNLPILMPTSGLRSMARNMMYNKAVFHVDPEQNRNLDEFRAQLEALANRPRIGGVPVRTILRDEELQMVVEPIEASIRLMQVLYPVTLVLSLLAAGGVSALLVVLSAKEAAMMRVQGATRVRTILMLSLQQTFTCVAGLLVGLAGVLLWLGGARPDLLPGIAPGAALCAALYLAAGVGGAAASSAAVTNKNPLEMLQVKE